MDQQTTSSMPPLQTKSSAGGSARYFFFFFLLFALLYVIAINFGGVIFSIINKLVPQVGMYTYGTSFSSASLRFNIASLIVASPIFLWLSIKINREAHTDATIRHSAIRRWLTYITLIITALIVIGDLIALLNNLLSGEIATRFILKALTVLIIAGGIFYYYLEDIKALRKESDAGTKYLNPLSKIYGMAVPVLLAVAIVVGFLNIESPTTARARSNDDLRLMHLQNIEGSIYEYARVNKKLPTTLSEVQIRQDLLNDPITGQPYEYQATSELNYELCATFETSNKEAGRGADPYSDPFGPYSWLHDTGRACFTKAIDTATLEEPVFKTVPAL